MSNFEAGNWLLLHQVLGLKQGQTLRWMGIMIQRYSEEGYIITGPQREVTLKHARPHQVSQLVLDMARWSMPEHVREHKAQLQQYLWLLDEERLNETRRVRASQRRRLHEIDEQYQRRMRLIAQEITQIESIA